jgi:type II secretory pathway pseudopilin PulG
MKAKKRCGFTLPEMLGVLAGVAIVVTMIAPSVVRMQNAATWSQAVGVAQALDMTKAAFLGAVPNAQAVWDAAADDAAKYQLLKNAGCIPASLPGTWAALSNRTQPYTLSLGSLQSKVAINGSTNY